MWDAGNIPIGWPSVPMTFEALLVLIFAAAVIAGLALSLGHARASQQHATEALAKTEENRATAERERGLAVQEVRQLRHDVAQLTVEREEWRSELRKARIALSDARSALAQSEGEREELQLRLEPAQQIIRDAVAIRATIDTERAAQVRELFERRVRGEHEVIQLRVEADALRNAHAIALQRYQSLRRAIGTLQSRLAESRTNADSPEVRPVTPQSSGTQALLAPEIRPKGQRARLS